MRYRPFVSSKIDSESEEWMEDMGIGAFNYNHDFEYQQSIILSSTKHDMFFVIGMEEVINRKTGLIMLCTIVQSYAYAKKHTILKQVGVYR